MSSDTTATNTVQPAHDDISNQTAVDQLPLERSTDVWFDDGNCVLQAENKLFKVYTGMLMKYSAQFQTMLSLPQPDATSADTQPMYENCPLILLPGDSAKDAGYFLKALSDLQYYTDVTKIKDISIVLAVINMSLKYEADVLLRRSIPAFTALYPASLAKWEIRSRRRQYAPFVQAYGPALPFLVIAVAKKTGMDMLLPSAMFECCSYSIFDIMDGVARPNGEYLHLDHESKRKILKARTQISNYARGMKNKVVTKARITYPCSGRRSVLNAGGTNIVQDSWNILEGWAQGSDGPDSWVDPLRTAESWPANAYSQATRTTLPSAEIIAKNMKANYAQAWKNLPKAFELQEWDKLKRAWIH
ncbi:hypothetical protein BDY19DRAFT_722481 [Irpex rosettiformis]|uniref:Uncharacterized protein n=1 Tax=Irpex rosettiformis TaxID=378272 RepID=A0ACB8U8W7_9APHY|nr:hypothetical protein BDY19DRAFT_722481 [Irpex rosettiformis]